MKRFHEYEKETTETYYALGKGDKFLMSTSTDSSDKHILCSEPTNANSFVRYITAKKWLDDNSELLKGFKVYSIRHVVKTQTHYTVLDCDIYKEEQKGIKVAK